MNAQLAEVTLEDTVHGAVVVARGQFDLATVWPLRSVLEQACRDRVDDVVVDFADVTFCESRTAALLASTAAKLKAGGRGLTLRGAEPRHARVFGLLGFDHLLAPA
jgi:anti-anti-sigma factor